jgi:hypothetical protein
VRCAGSRSCPFPPLLGEAYCREHWADQQLSLTLHETSLGRVRKQEEFVLAPGAGITIFSAGKQALFKLKTRLRGSRYVKMTEEERRRKYMNTYCMAVLPEGRLCQNRIPVDDRICEACRERLLPTGKAENAAKKAT